MKHIKGGSAHFINTSAVTQGKYIAWQPGYGLLTYSRRDLPNVVRYINHQKQHHASGQIWSSMERMDTNKPPGTATSGVPEGHSV
jgi:putative transposase